MEKRIDLERRGRKPGTITELNLDNCRSTSIVGLTDEYSALQSLSLINVGLTTLKGFPKLPNLKKLELSDNRISNGLNLLHTSPKLQYLNLSGNKIKDLDTLKPLKEFQHLAVLDLFNNEATQTENYREKIFELLPSLKFLDGFDCNDVEAPSEGDDEEENGNYSEDEDRIRKEQEQVKQKRKPKEEEAEEEEQVENEEEQYRAFCLNGIEIDLDELEAFENCLKMKRHQMIMTKDPNSVEVASAMIAHSCEQRDDLDEYFEKLQLNQTEIMDNKRQKVEKDYNSESDNSGDDEDAGSDDFSEDEDNGDVSLAEVYNDDLEEDEDDWDEGNAEGEDDDDVDTDIDDLNDSVATASAQDKEKVQASNNVNNDAAEEPETRGKKRKLDG